MDYLKNKIVETALENLEAQNRKIEAYSMVAFMAATTCGGIAGIGIAIASNASQWLSTGTIGAAISGITAIAATTLITPCWMVLSPVQNDAIDALIESERKGEVTVVLDKKNCRVINAEETDPEIGISLPFIGWPGWITRKKFLSRKKALIGFAPNSP